ncbi:beta-ribofuranosylaminobenzene 5'-phosphate synthase family [Rhodopirellula sp. SWK7]|uniref:GHMP family kinase ATP-binding protein n=1 Tax=Rhodopirellula sp. SWK7 TaxID=595460 RepID=UPI0002BDAA33|nr:beta-ribofuranosylaminobenzene 5'-phosphate synthase family [Rhodopirellula sp. SWK7]EMI43001.1 beta-ribofuranosylaminobenzene 5'-phosphate synthase family [Rhodopirellula sp. SWK7]
MKRVRITTGARLHFGLLDIASPFGGCGVMIDRPATVVEARPSFEFEYSQVDSSVDHRDRAIAIAERIAERIEPGRSLPPVHVEVQSLAPAHSGLGSGTQLSLAISEAILHAYPAKRGDDSDLDLSSDVAESGPAVGQDLNQGAELNRELWLRGADRGRRSAVGTHGYLSGGFIVEGLDADRGGTTPNPLDMRLEMPSQWRVAILFPKVPLSSEVSVSGEQEQARFESLSPVPPDRRDHLAKLLTDTLVPAIKDGDFDGFCSAATRYNRLSGELFADVQGGAYNGEATTRLIDQLLDAGFDGVGQSSWGPGVFVWHRDEESAERFQRTWSSPQYHILVARPKDNGRCVKTLPDEST